MKTLFLISMLFTSILINAQTTISTGGGNATGTGIVSYTVGQVFYAPISNVTPGVQQSNYDIKDITKDISDYNMSLTASVYPNPTVDILTLDVVSDDVFNLNITLYDMSGKVLIKQSISKNKTELNLGSYKPNIYILRVYSNSTEVKTYKIIKK